MGSNQRIIRSYLRGGLQAVIFVAAFVAAEPSSLLAGETHPSCHVLASRCIPLISDVNAKFAQIYSQSHELALNYPADGCAPRAHVISEMFLEAGYSRRVIGKIWNVAKPEAEVENDRNVLHVVTPANDRSSDVEQIDVYWGWHVAVTVEALDAQDHIATYVIDPLLANHPIEVNDWRARMNDPSAELILTPLEQSPSGHGIGYGVSDDDGLTWTQMDESARSALAEYSAKSEFLPDAPAHAPS